jgi:hypothetical protein
MRSPKPFTCTQCRRKTDELRYCSACGREICFACIIRGGNEMAYALGEYLCKKCAEKARRK